MIIVLLEYANFNVKLIYDFSSSSTYIFMWDVDRFVLIYIFYIKFKKLTIIIIWFLGLHWNPSIEIHKKKLIRRRNKNKRSTLFNALFEIFITLFNLEQMSYLKFS